MNRSPIVRAGCLLAAMALWLGAAAAAAPRYTDKETALELARALEQGVFRGHLITSTFIEGRGEGRYQLKVVLDDNTVQEWTLPQLHRWSQEEAVLLRGNRALLFPRADSNRFVTLDKNAFARRALKATIYCKAYREPDPLAGQRICYAVNRFNLVELVGLRPGKDRRGYRHHYVFDLVNGQRERLSYLDAHRLLERGGLLNDPGRAGAVMVRPYRLQEIHARPIGEGANGDGNGEGREGLARFSVEMVFDRPVGLEPGHFPVRVFERANQRSLFVLELMMPNAEVAPDVQPIERLEFLSAIQAVPDLRYQKRIRLQARVAPEVLNFPPQVEVEDRTVRVEFVKVVDQSVLDRRTLFEMSLRRRREDVLGRQLSREERRQQRSYVLSYDAGLAQSQRAEGADTLARRVEWLTTALANFNAAAENAQTDRQLQEALKRRNALEQRIPATVVERVRARLEGDAVQDAQALRELLDTAAAITRDVETLRAIRDLQQRLSP